MYTYIVGIRELSSNRCKYRAVSKPF